METKSKRKNKEKEKERKRDFFLFWSNNNNISILLNNHINSLEAVCFCMSPHPNVNILFALLVDILCNHLAKNCEQFNL